MESVEADMQPVDFKALESEIDLALLDIRPDLPEFIHNQSAANQHNISNSYIAEAPLNRS